MVNDVADVPEKASAGPMHTPTLYSCFLRALVSAKTEPPPTNAASSHVPNGDAHSSSHDQTPHSTALGENGYAFDPLGEFQFEGEMGPVADMSTFPPTMAPNPSEDHFDNMLTMDSILSSGFWDSVLVPGALLGDSCVAATR